MRAKGVVDWSPGAFASTRRQHEVAWLSWLVCLGILAMLLAAIAGEQWTVVGVAALIPSSNVTVRGEVAYGPRSCEGCDGERASKFNAALAFLVLALVGMVAVSAAALGALLPPGRTDSVMGTNFGWRTGGPNSTLFTV